MVGSLFFLPIGVFPNGSEFFGRVRMQADLPFFECPMDAVRSAVQALGGAKQVGSRLWPEKSPDGAGRLLLDCLNASRSEKLELAQVMRVLAWAREAGCHGPMQWICGEVGYEARPVTKAEEVDRLVTVIEETSRTMASALATLERLQRVRAAA
jgi:hypothetical protein